MTRNAPSRLRSLYYAASAMAVVFLLGMYARYALDMPYYDQWELVPLLEKMHEGTLRAGDLWAQHNEHRLVFPRLLMLVMAYWSDWNIYWELAANVVLAGLVWLVLLLVLRRTSEQVHYADNSPIYMLLTLILFSLSQWQNWFLGWQMQVFMSLLGIVSALACLTWRRFTTTGVVLAVGFGVLASFSFANGILIWPLGALLLFLQRPTRAGAFLREMTLWIMAGVVVTASYLYGYETPSYHPPLTNGLSQPLHAMLYVLTYLGQPLGNIDVALAVCVGGLGMVLWAVTLAQLLVSDVPRSAVLPWLGMALYAIGTAVLTALGRVDEGLEQALSPRYATLANLLWVAVVVQVYWVAQVSEGALIRRLLPLKLALITLALCAASLYGAYRWTEHYNAYSALREAMRTGQDAERLRPLYPPRPEVILERRGFLIEHGLSIFGNSASPANHENAAGK